MRKPSKPWYRKFNDTWYVCISGKQIQLAKGKGNRKEAERAFFRLMASETPVVVPSTPGNRPNRLSKLRFSSMTYTTRLIGHLVSIAAVVSETWGTTFPPVQANNAPPATAIADRSRNRRRETGSGW